MEIEVEKFGNMIAGSLGLTEPWYVSKVAFEAENTTAHIYVEVRKNVALCCPQCGGGTRRFGYEKRERTWRHADCLFYPCYVHCRRPKVQCPHCGVQQLTAPFERKNSRFTLLFEGYAMLLLPDMPLLKAAKLLRIDEKSLYNIMEYWVEKAIEKLDFQNVTSLAVDETSSKRGHNYVTLMIDAEMRRVIGVEEGKDKECFHKLTEFFQEHGGNTDKIETITSDMSKAFLSGIKDFYPNAESVVDKFHVKQKFVQALDQVRKDEQKVAKEKNELYRTRSLWLVPHAKATEEQAEKILTLSKSYQKTGRAYRIVASLDDFYACQTVDEAEIAFKKLYGWMRRSKLEPMKKVAKMFKNHKKEILAYFTNRLTNAICEGINSMVQAAKRKARGYHTFKTYRIMIFLIAGKLKLDAPRVFG